MVVCGAVVAAGMEDQGLSKYESSANQQSPPPGSTPATVYALGRPARTGADRRSAVSYDGRTGKPTTRVLFTKSRR